MSETGTPRTIQVEDHAAGVARMNEALAIDSATTAVLTVDMHRGHLDMTQATMPALPEESRRVLAGAAEMLACARQYGMKIFHVVLTLREIEFDRGINPRHTIGGVTFSAETVPTEAQKAGVKHNLAGSVQTELMPELDVQPADYVIRNKKTLSCFLGTELELLLKRENIDTLLVMGINTNTCVQNAAFDGFNHAYKVVVLSDCVSSMYGMDLHHFALENVARCLGWVMTNEEVKAKLREADWRRHNIAE